MDHAESWSLDDDHSTMISDDQRSWTTQSLDPSTMITQWWSRWSRINDDHSTMISDHGLFAESWSLDAMTRRSECGSFSHPILDNDHSTISDHGLSQSPDHSTRWLNHGDLMTCLAQTLACSLILSRIDYCNAVLHGAPSYSNKKLQRAQNNAARIVLEAPRRSHACWVNILRWFRCFCSCFLTKF